MKLLCGWGPNVQQLTDTFRPGQDGIESGSLSLCKRHERFSTTRTKATMPFYTV
jgi:hypothetical protein